MRGSLTSRCKLLEAHSVIVKPGPAAELRRSPLCWDGLGWLMEVDRNLEAVAFILAAQHNDAGVKALIQEITPQAIASSQRRPPTERQLIWLCEYLRALWPTCKDAPLIQQWLQRNREIKEGNHEDN